MSQKIFAWIGSPSRQQSTPLLREKIIIAACNASRQKQPVSFDRHGAVLPCWSTCRADPSATGSRSMLVLTPFSLSIGFSFICGHAGMKIGLGGRRVQSSCWSAKSKGISYPPSTGVEYHILRYRLITQELSLDHTHLSRCRYGRSVQSVTGFLR
jgi:hypothetical protein